MDIGEGLESLYCLVGMRSGSRECRTITGWITLYNPFPIEAFSSSPDGETQILNHMIVRNPSLHPTAISLPPHRPLLAIFEVLRNQGIAVVNVHASWTVTGGPILVHFKSLTYVFGPASESIKSLPAPRFRKALACIFRDGADNHLVGVGEGYYGAF